MFPLFAVPAALKALGWLIATTAVTETTRRVINYGGNCKDGSHDHRTNRGNDRTRSQKKGDRKRRKS